MPAHTNQTQRHGYNVWNRETLIAWVISWDMGKLFPATTKITNVQNGATVWTR